MRNTMDIEGHRAVVSYDPDIGMLRGEFVGLSGGADFYAENVKDLEREGRLSLQVYLDTCREKGAEPYRKFSGRFNVRLDPRTHEAAVAAAAAEGRSLNEWVAETIEAATRA